MLQQKKIAVKKIAAKEIAFNIEALGGKNGQRASLAAVWKLLAKQIAAKCGKKLYII